MAAPSKQSKRSNPKRPKRTIVGKSPAAAFAELKRTITPAQIAALKKMPYERFLETNFWAIVREYKLYKQKYTCALCPATVGLQVHHRRYDHARGGEHLHLDDLIGLCRDCHARHHNKLP